MKSRTHVLWKVALLCAFGFLIGESATTYKRAGKKDFLNELVFGRTDWAPGFSHSAFVSVSTGDRQEKVRETLGRPLSVGHTASNNEEHWHYTKPKDKKWTAEYEDWSVGSWTYRTVVFTNGLVTRIKNGFSMPMQNPSHPATP